MFLMIQTQKAHILFYVLYKPYKDCFCGKEISGQPQRD